MNREESQEVRDAVKDWNVEKIGGLSTSLTTKNTNATK